MDWYESKERVDSGYIEMRRVTVEEMRSLLTEHQLWLSTDGKQGRRADLENANLVKHKLSGAELKFAKLSWASMADMNLRNTDLSGADLSNAYLQRADLTNAHMAGANLTVAHLDHACLSGVNLRRSSLEDTFLGGANLSDADLRFANLQGVFARDADFTRANLESAILNQAKLEGANFSEALIYGVAAWDIETSDSTKQTGMIISSITHFSPIRVFDLAVAQFMNLLFRRAPIAKIIDATSRQSVLILGRFEDGGLQTLDLIAMVLQRQGLIPIVFSSARPQERDYTDTVRILANLARFVVADLSGPSVPHELMAIVPFTEVPTVRIIERGRKPYSLSKDLEKYPWLFGEVLYFESPLNLSTFLCDEVIPAVEGVRQKLLARLGGYDKG